MGRWAFSEVCLLCVCFILSVPHHAQFLRVYDAPSLDDRNRIAQAGTLDPHDRYANMQRIYGCRSYETVELTELGFPGRYVVMVHPFEA